jgi:cell fate (sporulation/competence/biofilm development) regulator YlbF (YheA/YmcA/DUF963 family)
MEEKDDSVVVFPYQRGEFLTQLNLFESLKKFRAQYTSLSTLITEVEEAMKTWQSPRNPREDLTQLHEKKSLQVWKRQKDRLEQKITMIEQQIQQAITSQGRK